MDSRNKKALVGIAAVLATGIAGWFGWRWWRSRGTVTVQPATVPPQISASPLTPRIDPRLQEVVRRGSEIR